MIANAEILLRISCDDLDAADRLATECAILLNAKWGGKSSVVTPGAVLAEATVEGIAEKRGAVRA